MAKYKPYTRFRKPSEYKKLFNLMPEHSHNSIKELLGTRLGSVKIDFSQIQFLLDAYTHINQGTRRKHELYEFTSEHLLKFIHYRINLMNENAPEEEMNNISVLRGQSHTLHRILHEIYKRNYDYQVNGEYVYRKRVPSRFLFNFRAVASNTVGFMLEEEYQKILSDFLGSQRYLEALTLSLLYRTGMDNCEILHLTTDLLSKEHNSEGFVTSEKVIDANDNISTYDIGKEEMEIMKLWVEHRGFEHSKIMATSDGYRVSELTDSWAEIFWRFDIKPKYNINYSHHYLMHDDRRRVIEWVAKSFRI